MKFQPTMLVAYADALWARTQQYREGDMVIFLPLFGCLLGFGIAGALGLYGGLEPASGWCGGWRGDGSKNKSLRKYCRRTFEV
jgi:hypothetical protein